MKFKLPPTPYSTPGVGTAGKTGLWRVEKPVISEKCNGCLLCWLYCPEVCIKKVGERKVVIDYEYCKGCGICADVCPVKAITMVPEG
ncbi:MAG TPA: ferredoxin [Candidatus Methanomethylia archaeon]|nr:4Fe-4S binding protein [Candidatus Verstraetearchaeota archaeon]HDI46869.1 ferredoxin [Candidatus Methanomethylicia archaeon]